MLESSHGRIESEKAYATQEDYQKNVLYNGGVDSAVQTEQGDDT